MKTMVLWGCAGILSLLSGISGAWAGTVAQVNEAGDAVELPLAADGRTVLQRLPLYQAGAVRYFSAGVGLDERQATYPPFSLKLIFTAGGKPFLAGVSVTIHPVSGGADVTIPEDRVEGPWLFVDAAPGLYDITATYGGVSQKLAGVAVQQGHSKTVYVRWKEDRGLSRPLPPRD